MRAFAWFQRKPAGARLCRKPSEKPLLSFRPSEARGEISVINIDLVFLPMRGKVLQRQYFSRDFSTARGFAFRSARLPQSPQPYRSVREVSDRSRDARATASRHRNGANVLFLDGHAARLFHVWNILTRRLSVGVIAAFFLYASGFFIGWIDLYCIQFLLNYWLFYVEIYQKTIFFIVILLTNWIQSCILSGEWISIISSPASLP